VACIPAASCLPEAGRCSQVCQPLGMMSSVLQVATAILYLADPVPPNVCRSAADLMQER
jgi:hypothetical protein